MISKEQKRSKFALMCIQEAMQLSRNGRVSDVLANSVVGAPTRILQNGLGQTMAFLMSKDEHYFTFKSIARWCERENSAINAKPLNFLTAITQLPQSQYLTLQEEALKMLQWLKRYAKAFQEESNESTH